MKGWEPFFILCLGTISFSCARMESGQRADAASDSPQLASLATGDSDPLIEDEPQTLVATKKTQGMEPLSWEKHQKDGPQWSSFLYQMIDQESLETLDYAEDIETFCPEYRKLSRQQKVNVWAQVIAGIARFESGYQPTCRYHEKTLGRDAVTGQGVYSEGLLQLSYQDTRWYKGCGFDWKKDRRLSQQDSQKTILNPYLNLQCGLRILTSQVKRTKRVLLEKNVYWAVLKIKGRYQKISEITAMTKQMKLCRPQDKLRSRALASN